MRLTSSLGSPGRNSESAAPARGGQIACVVRELLLGKGFEFTSVGSAELKGLDEPVPVYEVTA